MATIVGTLIIVALCCLLMSLGLIFAGKPLPGGCGKTVPGAPRCKNCPNRGKKIRELEQLAGESES